MKSSVLIALGAALLIGLVYWTTQRNAMPVEPTAPPASTPAATSGLENTNWMASMLGDQSVATLGMTAMFTSGTLSGSDGCNRYTTTYTTDGSSITISPQMAGTLMACEENVMAMAQDYKETLSQATTYSVENGMLTLLGSDSAVLLTFAVDAQTLSDSSWTVTGINNGNEAVVSVIIGTEVTLNFTGPQVNGNAGCNSYGGSYTESDGSLSISELSSTRMMCSTPEGVAEQEAQYLAALPQASVYQIENNTLTIRDENGAMLVTATRN